MTQQQNQINLNLHPQRLVALAIAAVALIFMFLPWWTKTSPDVQLSDSKGIGFGDFGLLSAAGILGVIIACFMGDKTKPFDKQTKMIAMGAFAAIAVGAIVHAIITGSQGGAAVVQDQYGQQYQTTVKASNGIGTWLALVAGVIGVVFVSGILNQFTAGRTTAPASFNPPTPPVPGATPPTPPGSVPPPPPPPSN